MAKDAVATMGAILPDDAGGRDAVHVAVVAVVAGHNLWPGAHIGLTTETSGSGEHMASASGVEHIGIADPFIKGKIDRGARFWLYLYPRTITALSHRWSHPAFPDAVEGVAYVPPSQKLNSEEWIRNHAADCNVTYQTMMSAAETWLECEDYYVQHDEETARNTFNSEFWNHYESVTGKKVPNDKRGSFFSCSC